MRCFPEYKRWAPLWLAPHSTDMPLHESLELRHCPGHSCIEKAVAVHYSQLDNQPKKIQSNSGFYTEGDSRLRVVREVLCRRMSCVQCPHLSWGKSGPWTACSQVLDQLPHLCLVFSVFPVSAWTKAAFAFPPLFYQSRASRPAGTIPSAIRLRHAEFKTWMMLSTLHSRQGQLAYQNPFFLLVVFAVEHSQGKLPSVSMPHTQRDRFRTAILPYTTGFYAPTRAHLFYSLFQLLVERPACSISQQVTLACTSKGCSRSDYRAGVAMGSLFMHTALALPW